MSISVNVHGSCVSRDGFNPISEGKIKVKHLFSRNNIVSAMMPPCDLEFSHGELVQYESEYAERCMTYALNKKTVGLLMESDASYLVVDFFDFCQPVIGFRDTTFSSYDYCFYHTKAFKEYKDEMMAVDFLAMPACFWYGYVSLYFDRVTEKYNGNVILNRLSCSGLYMDSGHAVKKIPENLHHFGSDRHNAALHALEEYVIQRYPQIHAVDITKYFIPDQSYNPDTTPVHYEEHYKMSLAQIYEKIMGGNAAHYNDEIPVCVAADLLDRQVTDDDFLKIYGAGKRVLPFSTGTVLDFIFNRYDLKDITDHRRWIACIYREYGKGKEKHEGASEVLGYILSRKWIWKKRDYDPLKKAAYEYLNNARRYLGMPVAELYREFQNDFEAGNTATWILELELLSLNALDFGDVAIFLEEYYRTIDDKYALSKLHHNMMK